MEQREGERNWMLDGFCENSCKELVLGLFHSSLLSTATVEIFTLFRVIAGAA